MDTNSAIELLNNTLPDTAKQVIRDIPEDQLLDFLNSENEFKNLVDEKFFKSYKTSKLEKTFKKNGLTENGLTLEVILRAYKRELLGQDQHLEQLINKYTEVERRWDKQSANLATTDTLRGTYIPIDLEDCWRVFDRDWGDETKEWVREQTEEEFTASQHFGTGLWIRNNWGLWAGSRLANYFRQKGIEHPDNMSGIILSTYYRHLEGEDINLDEFFNNKND